MCQRYHAACSKQEAFCEEFLVDLNATQAAIRPGYSEKTARSIGFENFSNPDVLKRLAELKQGKALRIQIIADYVLDMITKNLGRPMQKHAVLDHEGQETGEYRYEGAAANKSVELLDKHNGLFTDKHEHKFTGELSAIQIMRESDAEQAD